MASATSSTAGSSGAGRVSPLAVVSYGMDTDRVLKVWTFSEWNHLGKEDRPGGAIPDASGWVLLDKMPAAAKPAVLALPAPTGPPDMPGATSQQITRHFTEKVRRR
jgi:hypothetical protein